MTTLTSAMAPKPDAECAAIVLAQEAQLQWQRFTQEEAWELGNKIRSLFLERTQQKAPGYDAQGASIVISISLFNGMSLFQSAVGFNNAPDNWLWVAGKTNTVRRYGHSSFYVGRAAAAKGPNAVASLQRYAPELEYASHGGAVPIFMLGGGKQPVGVAVVSGLKQEFDHQLVVDAMVKLLGIEASDTVIA